MSAELTLSEWQTGGHQERSNVTAQLCPGIYKYLDYLNESINVVQILLISQIYDVPHIDEGDPTFLGGSHHCHTDNNTAPGGFGRSGTGVEQEHRCLLE